MSTWCARVIQPPLPRSSPAPQPLRSTYVAQELPKRPWPGTGLPWGISGPLGHRLGFSAVLALQNRHTLRRSPPDQSQIGSARQTDSPGGSWPGACFPTRHCLPSACLLSATVICLITLRFRSASPGYVHNTSSGLTRPFLEPTRLWHLLTFLLCADTTHSCCTTLAFFEHVPSVTS